MIYRITAINTQMLTSQCSLYHESLPIVEDCSCLQSLGLGGNEIQDEGMKKLADALKTNTRLTSLGLGGNQIGQLAW